MAKEVFISFIIWSYMQLLSHSLVITDLAYVLSEMSKLEE